MSGFELFLLAAAGLLAWYWFDSLKAREAGIAAVRRACERDGVQLLDESVAGQGLRPVRNDEGRVVLQRTYGFDYSESGFDRFRGAVVLRGREVVMLDISAHRRHLRVVH